MLILRSLLCVTEHEGLVVVLTGLCLQRRCRGYIGCLRLERSLDLDRHLPVSRKPWVLCPWLIGKYKLFALTMNDKQLFPIVDSTVFHYVYIYIYIHLYLLYYSRTLFTNTLHSRQSAYARSFLQIKRPNTKISYFILFFLIFFIPESCHACFVSSRIAIAIIFHCLSLLREQFCGNVKSKIIRTSKLQTIRGKKERKEEKNNSQ